MKGVVGRTERNIPTNPKKKEKVPKNNKKIFFGLDISLVSTLLACTISN